MNQDNSYIDETISNSQPPQEEFAKQEGIEQEGETTTHRKTIPSQVFIIIKEVIVLALFVIVATQWNYGNDTGGNFGLVIGVGMLFSPLALILNFLAINNHTKKWQLLIIPIFIIFDILLVALAPELMNLFH